MTNTEERMTTLSSTLVRFFGLASVTAGLLWSTGTVANLVVGGSLGPANTTWASVAVITHIIMVFALLGIYAGQAQRMGVAGTLGLIIGIAGTTLLVGEVTIAFARTVGAVEIFRPPLIIGVTGGLSLLLGVVLIGVATMRAQIFPKWAAGGFILAPILLPLGLIQADLAMIAILAASVGFIWLGWEVWSASGPARRNPGR